MPLADAPASNAALPTVLDVRGASPPPSTGDTPVPPSRRAIEKLSITAPRKEDEREPDKRPLELRLITRLIGYMRPYAAKRNWMFVMVILRSIQLPLVPWSIGAVIDGPIASHAPLSSILWGAFGVLVLSGSS